MSPSLVTVPLMVAGFPAINSNAVLTNVTFSDNTASNSGGGINNSYQGNITLNNVTFSGNTASVWWGDVATVGSIVLPHLTNVTFNGNTALNGGGMYNEGSCNPTVLNSILWGDSGGEIFNEAEMNNFVTVQLQRCAGRLPRHRQHRHRSAVGIRWEITAAGCKPWPCCLVRRPSTPPAATVQPQMGADLLVPLLTATWARSNRRVSAWPRRAAMVKAPSSWPPFPSRSVLQ